MSSRSGDVESPKPPPPSANPGPSRPPGSNWEGRARGAASLISLLLVFLLGAPEGHAAGSRRARGEPGTSWTTSLGFLLAVDSQEGDARASSSARGGLAGDGVLLTPLVGLEAEIHTPPLLEKLGRPRLFLRGGVSRAFDVGRTIEKEGSPGPIDIPIIDPDQDGNPDQRTPIAAVGGRGTRFETEVQPWGFMAGLGLAFEIPIAKDPGRTVRLKPSIEYRRERFQASAFVGSAQSIDASELCPCRSANFAITEKQTLHAIGPGLELEMDTGRLRSTIVTLYGAFRAYHVIDGGSLDFSGDGRFDDATPISLEGRFEREPWSFRFGVGLRFRWDPS